MSAQSPPVWYSRVPSGFWLESGNRLVFMQWLEDKLGIESPEDWYDLRRKTVVRYGGGVLLQHYNDSVPALVMDYLPWYDWKEWLFVRAPKDFWNEFENRRRYLDWLGEQLGYQEPEDWYRLTGKELSKHRGGTLASRFGARNLVMTHFPEYEWVEWRFHCVPRGFWSEPENCRRYLDWFASRLGYEKPEDWYGISAQLLCDHHGCGILTYHRGSPSAVVMENLTEHEWLEWKFLVAHNRFWTERANRLRYLEWLGKKLGFEKTEDWYRIRIEDFRENYGGYFLRLYHAKTFMIVMQHFPEHEWLE